MTLVLVLGVVMCGSAAALAVEQVLHGRTRRRATLRRARNYASTVAAPAPQAAVTVRRANLVEAIVPALSRITLKLSPRTRVADLQLRIAAAGLGSRLTAQQFLATKTILGVAGVILGFAAGGLTLQGLLFAIVLVIGSRVVPEFILSSRARSRADRLTAHLPAAIDQIAVSLEAGLGFDAAVSYFVRRGRSPLGGELGLMLTEIQMGEARTEAMKRLAERVPSDAMRSFVQTLVQSEGVGMSRTEILRGQARDLRNRRQLAAEEKAQKAPVKMLFPIVIFILPVLFVVIFGPAVHQLSRTLGH